MKQLVIDYLPWLLSVFTVLTMWMAGEKHKHTWVLGFVNQALWLVWIVLVQAWGLLPMNFALWVMYVNNHRKWNPKQSISTGPTGGYSLMDDPLLGIEVKDGVRTTYPIYPDPAKLRPHPMSFGPNGGISRGTNSLRAGERFIYTIDGRHGRADEILQDGDAYVTWDDGTWDCIKWNYMIPEKKT